MRDLSEAFGDSDQPQLEEAGHFYAPTWVGGRWFVGHRIPGINAISLDVHCGSRADAREVARQMNQQRALDNSQMHLRKNDGFAV